MDEAQHTEPSGSRRSFGGMFSGILSKQTSLDTDTSDRLRRGGKVKPGQGGKHLLARTSSSSGGGDVHMPPESPPSALSGSCPAADWVAAGQDAAMSHHWPGTSPQLHTTPSRGLFSKLLSKKKKQSRDSAAAYSSPSLGASSRGSESPSGHSVEQFSMLPGADVLAITPPCKSRSASHDAEAVFGSVYSTPVGPDAMHPTDLHCQEAYGGDTLDFRQMMPQDATGVFTPGFSQLLEAAGDRLHEPDTPQQTPGDERTVMLVSGAQLAQAGRMFDVPAMLLGPQPEESDSTAVEPATRGEDAMMLHDQPEEYCSAAAEPPTMAEGASAAAEAESSQAAMQQQTANDTQATTDAVTCAQRDTGFDEEDILQPVHQQQQPPAAVEDVQLLITGRPATGDNLVPLPIPLTAISQAIMSTATQPSAQEAATAAAEPAISGQSSSCQDATTEEASNAVELDVEQLSAGLDSDLEPEQSQPDAGDQETVSGGVAWPELEPSVPELEVPAQTVEELALSPVSESSAAGAMASEEMIIPAVPLEDGGVTIPVTHELGQPADTSLAKSVAQLPTANTTEPVSETALAEDSMVATSSSDAMSEAMTASPALEPVVAASPAAASTAVTSEIGAGGYELAVECLEEQEEAMQHTLIAKMQRQQQQEQDCCAAASPSSRTSASLPASTVQVEEVDTTEGLLEHVVHETAAADLAAAAESFDAPPLQLWPLNTDDVIIQSSIAGPQPAAESSDAALECEMSGADTETHAAIELPLPDLDEATSDQASGQSDSPPATTPAEPAEPTACAGSGSPPQHPAAPSPPWRSGSARKPRQSPLNLVRESMPLFVADPSRAMGGTLALEEEDLDDQDMQQIINNRSAQQPAGPLRSVLLTHGGPQRVAMGQFSGGFPSSLDPVAEASFSSVGSPIPEESPSPVGSIGSGNFSSQLDFQGDMSPMRPCQPYSHRNMDPSLQATPAAGSIGARSPSLAATPGSVYSTPTFAFNGKASIAQVCTTPQTGLTDVSVGSAIRQVTTAPVGLCDLSPAMPDMPEASPTLMLMPGGPGLNDTPANLQGNSGDGTTPSLLDARAASPSAVYATRFMATPFRGALAALPVDAALAAPLVDSSPFQLSECGMDTVCLADEAQRVAANLAMAAGGFAATPGRTPVVMTKASAASPASAASQGRSAAGAGSPTEELRDLHVVMLTKQLAEVQKKIKDVEAENLRLKEQVEIYEFEKTELNSQEEMEKQARQYAEEQLEDMRVEMQRLLQANNEQAQHMMSIQQESEARQQEAQRQFDILQQEHAQLAHNIAQLQDERNQVLDKLNLVDMQVTALKSNNADLSAAVEAEQQRCSELEAAVSARDRDLAEAGRCSVDAQARLEKMMEQMIAANTAKEHARQKAADEAVRVQQLMAEQQVWQEDRKKYSALKQKYSQKSAALREVELKLQAKEAENQELMSMCDQLLQQQEKH